MRTELPIEKKWFEKSRYFLLFNVLNLIIVVGVLSQSLKANLYGLTTDMDFQVARTTLGGHDSGSYLEGALQLLGLSEQTKLNNFVWQLWPPGMSIILFAFSQFDYFFQHALMAGVVIQTISVLVIQNNLRFITKLGTRSQTASFLLPLLFLAFFSPYRDWILGYGLLYAEGPALALLSSSIALIFLRERIITRNHAPCIFKKIEFTNKWLVALSGALFGLAAYFRGPFDTMMMACFLGWLVFHTINILRKKVQESFKNTWVFFGAYFIVTLPWRVTSYLLFQIPFFRWTSLSGDANWAYISNEELKQNGQEAWANGNLNWGCEIVTKECGRSSHHGVTDLIYVILNHPIDFLTLRIPQLVKTLALPGSELYPWVGPYNYLQSVVWLILVSTVTLLFARRVIQNRISFFEFVVIFCISSTVLLVLITHFESRYFLPATILTLMYCSSYKSLNTSHDRHPTKFF